MATFDVATAVAEFIADPNRITVELPHMTTGQRKSTKKLVEQCPELRCESYGFGAERQLHLFKNHGPEASCEEAAPMLFKSCVLTPPSVNIKNTFIDDWAALEAEPVVFRSLRHQLTNIGSDIASIVRTSDSMDQSTKASDKALQIGHAELQVRNTFIHFDGAPADERAVQSMPHGMFMHCVGAEASQRDYGYDTPTTMGCSTPTSSADEPEADSVLPEDRAGAGQQLPLSLGALVVVEGLVKNPSFNGQSAVVQGWDETAGRYEILLVSKHGSQQAKIKKENLRMILPCI